MTIRRYSTHRAVGSLAAALLMAVACGDGDTGGEGTRGRIVVVDRTSQALDRAEVEALSGTYGAGCTGHAPGESWTVEGVLWTLPSEGNCALTLTSVTTEEGRFDAERPIVLGEAFDPAKASTFNNDDDETGFYANAMLYRDPGEIEITLVYSDDPSFTTVTVPVSSP